MIFGINTLLWTAGFTESHLDLIPKCRALGADAIEMATFDFSTFPADEARKRLEAEEMPVVLCSALVGNHSLATADADIRNQTLDFLRHGIETAAEVGSPLLVGPFCSAVGLLPGRRRNNDEWNRVIEALQYLTPFCDQFDVSLALEPLNRFETYFLNTAADAKKLCDVVNDPRIGILYDTFHANIEEKSQAEAIRLLGNHILHVHTCENDRGTPGTGPIDWPGVAGALREIGYDKWCTIESFGPGIKEIAAAACIWRDLSAEPDDIPRDGTAFLRKLFA